MIRVGEFAIGPKLLVPPLAEFLYCNTDRLFFGYSRLKMSEKKVWSFPTDMVPTQIEKSLSDRKMSRHFFRHFFLGHFLRTNHTHTFFFRHFFRQIMKCLWKTNSHTQKFRLFFRQKKSVGTKKNHELTHSNSGLSVTKAKIRYTFVPALSEEEGVILTPQLPLFTCRLCS